MARSTRAAEETEQTGGENATAAPTGPATTNAEAVRRLEAEFDHTFKRDIGNDLTLDYLTKEQVESRLMETLGTWNVSWQRTTTGVNEKEDECYAAGELTLVWPEGQTSILSGVGGVKIKRFSRGTRQGQSMSVGNDMKAADSDAFKKAALRAGVGRYLSAKDPDEQQNFPGQPATTDYSGDAASAGVRFPTNNSTGNSTTGPIEVKSANGLRINGQWYNVSKFAPIDLGPFQKGQVVTIAHAPGKTFIDGVTLGGGQPVAAGAGDDDELQSLPF